jgi:hypothetical protein
MSASGHEDAERAAHNQALFRQVNERVRTLKDTFLNDALRSDWICECADTGCFQSIDMSVQEYEALRGEPQHFAVAPDERHVVPRVERVLRRGERYWIVEKVGVAARVATELDPREET